MPAYEEHPPDVLAALFRDFAGRSASAPLRDLGLAVADAPTVLDLCRRVTIGQPVPMLLIAAVRYLRMRESGLEAACLEWPMSAPAFLTYCGSHADAIRGLVTTRRLQTNHVGRCAGLLPAFAMVSAQVGRPLAMIEVGTSAGLNLVWDRFRYVYGETITWGDAGAPIVLRCALRGPGVPPLPPGGHSIPVAVRIGIDLAPLDVTRVDDLCWLMACYVGGNPVNLARANAAAETLRQAPPDLVAGDAVAVLPTLLDDTPDGAVPCVYHSVTTYQFSREHLRAFHEVLRAASLRRTVFHVEFEGAPSGGGMYEIRLSRLEGGSRAEATLALVHREGEWLAWTSDPGAREKRDQFDLGLNEAGGRPERATLPPP